MYVKERTGEITAKADMQAFRWETWVTGVLFLVISGTVYCVFHHSNPRNGGL